MPRWHHCRLRWPNNRSDLFARCQLARRQVPAQRQRNSSPGVRPCRRATSKTVLALCAASPRINHFSASDRLRRVDAMTSISATARGPDIARHRSYRLNKTHRRLAGSVQGGHHRRRTFVQPDEKKGLTSQDMRRLSQGEARFSFAAHKSLSDFVPVRGPSGISMCYIARGSNCYATTPNWRTTFGQAAARRRNAPSHSVRCSPPRNVEGRCGGKGAFLACQPAHQSRAFGRFAQPANWDA